MTAGQPSGTYAWGNGAPPVSELVLDAYERCGLTGIQLTSQYLQSARRSLNLVLSSWSNRGVNLWTVDEVAQYMPQGVGQYFDDASCIDILADSMTIRQYQMAAGVSVTPAFATTSASAAVTVSNLPASAIVGGYISIAVPVSVGGIVLQGFYQVQSAPAANQAVIVAASAATSTVASGGAVPTFSTVAANPAVSVFLPNHGLGSGETFNVQIAVTVGGLTLQGPYQVGEIGGANNFIITAPTPATSSATVAENNGLALIAVQAGGNNLTESAEPTDILIYPLSRGDWMAIPQKAVQGRPTSVWVDRQIVPQINVWPVPDASGPYELRYRRSRQVSDADLAGGQTMGVPFRMLEAFTADLAAHLAMKWAMARAPALATYAAAQWAMASAEDTERVSTFMVPDVSGYFD